MNHTIHPIQGLRHNVGIFDAPHDQFGPRVEIGGALRYSPMDLRHQGVQHAHLWPRARRQSTVCEPINPAPPMTSMCICSFPFPS